MRTITWRFLYRDLRISLTDLAVAWDDRSRRTLFLLLPDLKYPLSVDPACWPIAVDARGSGSNDDSVEPDIPISIDVLETADYLYLESQPGPPQFPDCLHPECGSVEEHGQLLGYDVADCTGTSALTNCGVTDSDEARCLRWLFGDDLNHHHLFRSVGTALEFRNLANLRIGGHAPFFVYRLRTEHVLRQPVESA